jgi:hypothetical protein
MFLKTCGTEQRFTFTRLLKANKHNRLVVLGTWLNTIQKVIRFDFLAASGKQIHSKQ